jgi:hypothetical protein
VPAGELERRVACARRQRREEHLGQHLGGLERGRERVEEQVGSRDLAGAGRTDGRDTPPEHAQGPRQLRGRIGMGNRAADGSAVPDGWVADKLERLAQERARAKHVLRAFELSLPRHGTDRDAVGAGVRVAEPVEATEVDERRGPGEPHVEERNEALAAREEGGVGVGGTQGHRLLDRFGNVVVERRRLHAGVPPSTTSPPFAIFSLRTISRSRSRRNTSGSRVRQS